MSSSDDKSNKLKRIPVSEFTSFSPWTVGADAPYLEILEIIAREGVRHLPVLDAGEVVGVVSQRNLKVFSEYPETHTLTARDLMAENPFTVRADQSLEETAFEMSKRKIGSAVVLDDKGELAGVFTTTDALNALIEIIRGDV